MKETEADLNNLKNLLPDSRRFKTYVRDKSKRGRSLALAQILAKLQTAYPDFEPILRDAIFLIREQGADAERKRARVINALKNYATEINEIAEETNIDKTEVRKICLQLVKEKLVRADYRTTLRLGAGNKIELFFWKQNEEKLK